MREFMLAENDEISEKERFMSKLVCSCGEEIDPLPDFANGGFAAECSKCRCHWYFIPDVFVIERVEEEKRVKV